MSGRKNKTNLISPFAQRDGAAEPSASGRQHRLNWLLPSTHSQLSQLGHLDPPSHALGLQIALKTKKYYVGKHIREKNLGTYWIFFDTQGCFLRQIKKQVEKMHCSFEEIQVLNLRILTLVQC